MFTAGRRAATATVITARSATISPEGRSPTTTLVAAKSATIFPEGRSTTTTLVAARSATISTEGRSPTTTLVAARSATISSKGRSPTTTVVTARSTTISSHGWSAATTKITPVATARSPRPVSGPAIPIIFSRARAHHPARRLGNRLTGPEQHSRHRQEFSAEFHLALLVTTGTMTPPGSILTGGTDFSKRGIRRIAGQRHIGPTPLKPRPDRQVSGLGPGSE